jgi:hypothetical protein
MSSSEDETDPTDQTDQTLAAWEAKLRRYARTELQKAPLTGRLLAAMVRIHLVFSLSGALPAAQEPKEPEEPEDDPVTQPTTAWLKDMYKQFSVVQEPTPGLATFLVSYPPKNMRMDTYKKSAVYKRDVAMANELAKTMPFLHDDSDAVITDEMIANFLFKNAVFCAMRNEGKKWPDHLGEYLLKNCIELGIANCGPDGKAVPMSRYTTIAAEEGADTSALTGEYYVQPFYVDNKDHDIKRPAIFTYIIFEIGGYNNYSLILKSDTSKSWLFKHTAGSTDITINIATHVTDQCYSYLGFAPTDKPKNGHYIQLSMSTANLIFSIAEPPTPQQEA